MEKKSPDVVLARRLSRLLTAEDSEGMWPWNQLYGNGVSRLLGPVGRRQST